MARARLILAALALASCAGSAAPEPPAAIPPPQCAARADVLKHLAAKYGERVVAIGVDNRGGVVELVASAETWTLVLTGPRGLSCMIAAGEDWQAIPQGRGV